MPQLGDEYSTLGETPNNTNFNNYLSCWWWINSNVSSGDLTTTPVLE